MMYIFKKSTALAIMLCCLVLGSCKSNKAKLNEVDYVTETSGKVDFGKTSSSAYTPEIRSNMEQLYEDKLGMFIHWGPYAQLEGMWDGKEVTAEWIMNRAKISVDDYEQYAAGLFKPEKFNASDWVDIAEDAGMRFMVMTAKHHDGFAMYKSQHPYNLVDFAGFQRDVFKELSDVCAEREMKLGFYYSQSQDWHEEGGAGNSWDFGSRIKPQDKFDAYFNNKAVMQVNELSKNYGDIFMVWFDTPLQMDDAKCQRMMDLVKENQPGALVNSRLGQGFGHFDVSIDNGKTPSVSKATWLSDLKVPWQTHESVTQRGWGYTSYGAENDRSAEYSDFIYSLCRIVGNGGVYLLNVAPRPDGTIPQSQVNSITAIGDWLKINGEAIYGADPSPLKFPPYAITSKPGKVYLHIKDLVEHRVDLSGLLSKVNKAYCLADETMQPLEFYQEGAELSVSIPKSSIAPRVTVIVLEIANQKAQVIDETIQQEVNGSLHLPVAQCEFAIRRISYDYEKKVTHRWGENIKQGLVWTVNVTKLGEYQVVSEDNGNNAFTYNLISEMDTLELNAKGTEGEMTMKKQAVSITFNKTGIFKLAAYPKQTIGMSSQYKFKGLHLIPQE